MVPRVDAVNVIPPTLI